MTTLLVWKEYLKATYAKYEVYITPVAKFLLALIALLIVNGKLGFMERINSFSIVLIASLLCSLLPWSAIMLMGSLFILLHLYALSLECAVVVFTLFLILYLLYFRFSPNGAIAVLLTPITCAMGLPFTVPVSVGLVGSPAGAVSVACGAIVYSVIATISESVQALNSIDAENAVQRYRYVVDGLLNNKAMIVLVAAFVIVVALTYTIRRLAINHAWTIANIAGCVAGIVVLLVGDLALDTNISIWKMVLGAVLSFGFVKVLQFFVFNVDYTRTERVQFEDDEYYYYVKAVPKIKMTKPEKRVKKINTPKRR